MLRLRTSTGLSLLALAIGIAGTGWLSTLTSQWAWQPKRAIMAGHHATPAARRLAHQRQVAQSGPVSVVRQHRRTSNAVPVGELAGAQAAAVTSTVKLIPLATPVDASRPWYQLQGHLDGRVVVHLTIDGNGHVITAAMRESSNDPILDEHALRSVHHWRFAVPADHPKGFSGDLPMRFASQGSDIARSQ